MQKFLLTIGIVNWNTREYLKNLLFQIFESPPNMPFETIVVDNDSDDGSSLLIEKSFPTVVLIKNQNNIGFTKACNQILSTAKGNYIALLNTDIILRPNVIDDIIKLMQLNPKIGICGPKLLNKNGSLQLSVHRFHNLYLTVLEEIPKLNAYIQRWFLNKISGYKTKENLYINVDYVSGAFYVIRRKVISEVGLFDERYLLYCQEVDYAYRANQHGWDIAYYPYASAIHYRGESASKLLWRRLYFLYSDRCLFLRKVYGQHVGRLYIAAVFFIKLSQFFLMNFAGLVRPLRHDFRSEAYAAKKIYYSNDKN